MTRDKGRGKIQYAKKRISRGNAGLQRRNQWLRDFITASLEPTLEHPNENLAYSGVNGRRENAVCVN